MKLIQILDNGEEKLLIEVPASSPAKIRHRLWGESGLNLPCTVRTIADFNRELRGLPFVVRESSSTHNFKWQKGTTSTISEKEEQFWAKHTDGQLTTEDISELKAIRRKANSKKWDAKRIKQFSLYIDPNLFKEFKELAIKEKISVSKAVNILMEHSIDHVKEGGKIKDYRVKKRTKKA